MNYVNLLNKTSNEPQFAKGMNRQEIYEPTTTGRDLSPIYSLVELLNDMEQASSVELITKEGAEFVLLFRSALPTPPRGGEKSSSPEQNLIIISSIGFLCEWAKVYDYIVRLEYDPLSYSEPVIAAHMRERGYNDIN